MHQSAGAMAEIDVVNGHATITEPNGRQFFVNLQKKKELQRNRPWDKFMPSPLPGKIPAGSLPYTDFRADFLARYNSEQCFLMLVRAADTRFRPALRESAARAALGLIRDPKVREKLAEKLKAAPLDDVMVHNIPNTELQILVKGL